jgi:tetratricopeptide (TPR) repeat protein
MIPALVDYLAMFYQKGNLAQVEAITRSMLVAIPDDIVALGFLGLALYQMGRIDDAYRAFKKVATGVSQQEASERSTGCELARFATFRAATQAHCGLADGWYRIAVILNKLGFSNPAACALKAASAAGGSSETIHARLE